MENLYSVIRVSDNRNTQRYQRKTDIRKKYPIPGNYYDHLSHGKGFPYRSLNRRNVVSGERGVTGSVFDTAWGGNTAGNRIWRRAAASCMRSVSGRKNGWNITADRFISAISGIFVPVALGKSTKKDTTAVCPVFVGSLSDLSGTGGRIKFQKGSYTVEAALLMGMILSVLISVIYIGFWYHDKSFLQSAAYEAVCVADLHTEDDDWKMEKAVNTITAGRMLGTRGVQSQCQNNKKKATVSFQGQFNIPGMVVAFFQKGKLTIQESCTQTIEKPSKKIQKIRGIMKVAKGAGGSTE